MRPDLIVEHVGGLHLFSGETERGREWLANRATSAGCQQLGKSLAVESERNTRDLVDTGRSGNGQADSSSSSINCF